MPDIDIVIPAAGRQADLLRLLSSLVQHGGSSLAAHVASITVTDDRPTPELRAVIAAQFPNVRYVHGPARGPAANRNHGARQGQAAWIVFLDDDCYLSGDLIAAYAQSAGTGPQAFEGAVRSEGPRPNGNHHAPLNLEGGAFWTCNVMVSRAVFDAVGGFDEDFPFACMEDCDLRERLIAAGAKPVFVPAASVVHPWRSISEREVSRAIVSHAIYGEKHRRFADEFGLLHVLHAMAGRVRLYRSGRFTTIPLAKYRTVAYDFCAPLIVLFVVRLSILRRSIVRRYVPHAIH